MVGFLSLSILWGEMPLSTWARRHPSLLLCSSESSSFVVETRHSGARSEIINELCLGGLGGNPRCPELRLAWDLPLHGAGCVKMFLIMLMMTSTPTSLCFLLLPCASENMLCRAAWWNFIETSLTLHQQHFYFSFSLLSHFFFSFSVNKYSALCWGEDLGGVSGKSFFTF